MFGGSIQRDTIGGDGQTESSCGDCPGATASEAFPLAPQWSRNPDLWCCRLVPSEPCMADRLALGHLCHTRHTPRGLGELHAVVATLGAPKAAVVAQQHWTI